MMAASPAKGVELGTKGLKFAEKFNVGGPTTKVYFIWYLVRNHLKLKTPLDLVAPLVADCIRFGYIFFVLSPLYGRENRMYVLRWRGYGYGLAICTLPETKK